MSTTTLDTDRTTGLVPDMITFLETGTVADGLFAPDVFFDFTSPLWRQQARGQDGLVAIRLAGHPGPATVVRHRVDPTRTGFVLEFEEEWDAEGEHWYAREMARADVTEQGISRLSVYCTGDWPSRLVARHREQVTLLEP